MPGERFPPDDPREWLNRAWSNLAKARGIYGTHEVYLEDLCFDAQQAAEKAIKAVLIHLAVRFPYVHDLAQLLALIEQAGQSIPEPVRQAGSKSVGLCSGNSLSRPFRTGHSTRVRGGRRYCGGGGSVGAGHYRGVDG